MKKIFLLLVFTITLGFAKDADFYFGTSVGSYNENFETHTNISLATQITNIKVGYGLRDAYAVEFSLDYMQNKSKIFSSAGSYDGNRYGFNLHLVKAFHLNTFFLPFFKAGFGSGFMKIQRAMQTKLSYGSFNLCAGTFIPLNRKFDVELGYQYRYVTYESINTITQYLRYKAHANIAYIGINFRF